MEEMERESFLTALQISCRDLMRFFAERGHEWLTSVMTEGADPELGSLRTDRIYELLCYLSLLGGLSDKVDLELKQAPGPLGYRFPYGPGDKKNFAFFRFGHQRQTYDLCCGTALPVRNEEPEHPDISLQEMKGDDAPREPGRPIAIWDAKYHSGGQSQKKELQQMNWWCDIFVLMSPYEGDILEKLMPEVCQVNAVLTNAKEKKINKTQLLKRGFSIVFEFVGPGSGKKPVPSRADHLEAQKKNQK